MSDTRNKSFSLLNQQEIDTLVKFLTESKSTVDSDVMNQNSIDKLITLIQTDKGRIALNTSTSLDALEAPSLKKLHFRSSKKELCELRCAANPDTNFLELSIYNTVTGQTVIITPKTFDEKDTEDWGYTIAPAYFNQIAQSLSLKFTRETYDSICSSFAKLNYGSAGHRISDIYLPENESLLETLL